MEGGTATSESLLPSIHLLIVLLLLNTPYEVSHKSYMHAHKSTHSLSFLPLIIILFNKLSSDLIHTHRPHPPLDYRGAIKPLPLVKPNHGLHLKALVDIDADESGVARKAGDEWLLKGPATYIPRPDVVRRWIKLISRERNKLMLLSFACMF